MCSTRATCHLPPATGFRESQRQHLSMGVENFKLQKSPRAGSWLLCVHSSWQASPVPSSQASQIPVQEVGSPAPSGNVVSFFLLALINTLI